MAQLFSKKYFVQVIAIAALVVVVALFFILGGKWGRTIQGVGTNIDSGATNHWAWNDTIGWIDLYTPATVVVSNSGVSGYASSSIGAISFDCATTPNGNVCGSSNYSVANDGTGRLSGYAWNDVIGWISFCNNQVGQAACSGGGQSYQVVINGSTGAWSGYAWNDLVGWISFNCINTATCGTVDYKVLTTWTSTSSVGWLESATYDTGVAQGAQINSILWHGSQPVGTAVKFQMAFSSSSLGPWNFSWDSLSSTSPSVAPNTSLPIDYTLGENQRYFRYKVFLYSDPAHTTSSRIDDVLINWSR